MLTLEAKDVLRKRGTHGFWNSVTEIHGNVKAKEDIGRAMKLCATI